MAYNPQSESTNNQSKVTITTKHKCSPFSVLQSEHRELTECALFGMPPLCPYLCPQMNQPNPHVPSTWANITLNCQILAWPHPVVSCLPSRRAIDLYLDAIVMKPVWSRRLISWKVWGFQTAVFTTCQSGDHVVTRSTWHHWESAPVSTNRLFNHRHGNQQQPYLRVKSLKK